MKDVGSIGSIITIIDLYGKASGTKDLFPKEVLVIACYKAWESCIDSGSRCPSSYRSGDLTRCTGLPIQPHQSHCHTSKSYVFNL